MVFGIGEKKKKTDEVKEAVSGGNPAMNVRGIPGHIADLEYKEPMPTMDHIRDNTPDDLRMVEPMPEKAKFAPLFVKVEKYREILESINRMKMVIVNLHSMIEVQNNIRTLRAQVDKELHKEIAQLNEVIQNLDTQLIRPKSIEPYVMPKPSETAKMQGYVSELEGELSKLQDQIKKIE